MRPPPITAFVGVNGSGKTLSAIAYAARGERRWGRRVLTNVPGTRFDQFETLDDLSNDPLGLQDTDVVFDEAGVIFASRSTKRDEQFNAVVQQLRKSNSRLFWTAPAWARADKQLREVTQVVVKCRGIGDIRPRGVVWPEPVLVLNVAFNTKDIDTMGQTVSRRAKRAGFGVWVVRRQGVLFDTLGRVEAGPQGRRAVPVEETRLAVVSENNGGATR